MDIVFSQLASIHTASNRSPDSVRRSTPRALKARWLSRNPVLSRGVNAWRKWSQWDILSWDYELFHERPRHSTGWALEMWHSNEKTTCFMPPWFLAVGFSSNPPILERGADHRRILPGVHTPLWPRSKMSEEHSPQEGGPRRTGHQRGPPQAKEQWTRVADQESFSAKVESSPISQMRVLEWNESFLSLPRCVTRCVGGVKLIIPRKVARPLRAVSVSRTEMSHYSVIFVLDLSVYSKSWTLATGISSLDFK